MQYCGVLRRSPIGVDRHLVARICAVTAKVPGSAGAALRSVSELIACLDRLHLALCALRVLCREATERIARLLVLLQVRESCQVCRAIARLLPVVNCPANVSEAGRLVGVSGGRLQAGDDGTALAGETEAAFDRFRTCMMFALDWPHSCCGTLGCWSPCLRIAAAVW